MPLFARVLGPAFATLAAPVQALHAASLPCRYAGQARIERGRHWLVPLLAAAARLPQSVARPALHFPGRCDLALGRSPDPL